MSVIDFKAARMRIEGRAIAQAVARARDERNDTTCIEFIPTATLLERFAATMTEADLNELIHTTLEESHE